MSFVICTLCKYWGLMLGDTIALNMDKTISSDNAQKIYRINENSVIATAGYTGLTHPLIENIMYNNHKADLTYVECSNILMNNTKRIEKSYKKFTEIQNINSGIGLMGTNNGIINFLFISFVNGEISLSKKEFLNEDDATISILGNGMYGNLGDLFWQEYNQNPIISINNITSIFKKTLSTESKKDISINNNFISEVIFNCSN